MAQHKASLEKTLQSALKHKKAGTEMATAIVAVEALVASGIDTAAIVENTDKKVISRTRAIACHKVFGKRLADAMSTLDAIIAEEAITVVAMDQDLTGAPHKGSLNTVGIKEIARRDIGLQVAALITNLEQVVDDVLRTTIVLHDELGTSGSIAFLVARDLPQMHAKSHQQRVVVQHLLEVRHQPVGVGAVAREATADLIE